MLTVKLAHRKVIHRMNTTHIVSAFDKELKDIEFLTLEMGGRVELQILEATQALDSRDTARAEKTVKADKEIDRLHEQVDENIIKLIALRQPKAVDLRLVMGASKVAASLERIGDYAKNIAKRTNVISQSPPIREATSTLKTISELVQAMLKDVLDAYVRRDVALATNVRFRDQEVDHIYTTQFRGLLTHMIEDPRSITPAMHLMFVAKNLERIGDHITGIAEQVYFMVEGQYPEDGRPKTDMTSYTTAED